MIKHWTRTLRVALTALTTIGFPTGGGGIWLN